MTSKIEELQTRSFKSEKKFDILTEQKSNDKIENIDCNICEEIFTDGKKLKAHMKEHHYSRFKCDANSVAVNSF